MEQTVRERPPQEHCISQLHVQRRTHFLHDRGTSTPRGSLGGDHLTQDRAQIAQCRDYFRGTCARGSSCRYQHAEPSEHGESTFYESERGGIGIGSKLGNSQLYRESKENDSRTRFASGGYRSRSPCRRFQSGTCFRGSSCHYLHTELIRYEKPKYNGSVEQQQVHGAVGIPGFNGGNRDNASRISNGQEEVNTGNYTRTMSFSRERRSRSPCRNFLRGNCIFGSNCRRFHPSNNVVMSRTDFGSQHHQRLAQTVCGDGQPDFTLRTPRGYDESNTHNFSRTGAFPREPRRRSPCRNFLSGNCYRGESCAHLHPAPVSDRTRYNSLRTQRCDGVPAPMGTPHFNNGTSTTSSRIFQNNDNRNHQEIHARSTKDDMQLAGNTENMDVPSRNWSSERHRSSNTSDFGGSKLVREPEVCIRFTKGICTNGESCRYLHGYHYHKYASFNWSIKPTETLGVEHQYADIVMAEQHNGVKTTTEPSTLDQKGDASVVHGQKREISGEKSVGVCNSAEGHEEVSLWSRPFKRRRSRSRSPLAPRNDFRCTNFRRHDSQVDFHHDRRYNVAHFQYPGRRSHTFERPMYRVNGNQSSNAVETSMNPCYRGKYDSKSVGRQRHEATVYEGPQLAQNSSCGSQIESVGKENDKELARDNIAVGMPQGVGDIKMGELESDSASLSEVVSQEAICSSMKEGIVELNNVKNEEVIPAMQPCESKSCQGPGSCEETMNGVNISKRQEKVEPSLAIEEVSRRKLLVLDVNGILADIVSDYPPRYTPDTIVSAKGVFKRPFCEDFLQFCFERYDVGIWSSRNKRNVTSVVDFLMKDTKNRLLFCWDQSHCTATGYNTIENWDKPLVLKELKKLWDKADETLPWKKGFYNETNTILLDDSPYKALRNPPYTAVFPYAYTFKDVQDKSLGPGGDLRVYLERLAEAENAQKFIEENPFGQRPITKKNLSWGFYAKIVGTSDEILPQEKAKVITSVRIQPEEKANIIGSSDGILPQEKAKVCSSVRTQPEEKANIVSTSDGRQQKEEAEKLEETDIVGISNGSQPKEEAEKLEDTEIVGISNGSQLEVVTEIVDPSDRSQTEEETKIGGASDGSQLEENTSVGTSDRSGVEEKGTFNGSQLEVETEIVDHSDRSQTEEETKIGGASDESQLEENTSVGTSGRSEVEEKGTFNGSQLEVETEIVDPSDISQTEEETIIGGAFDGSQLEEKTQSVGTSGRSEVEEKDTFNGSQQEGSANLTIVDS